jgi:hypothetical protein
MTQAASLFDAFTAAERELIRRAFGQHFGSYPAIAEGIYLRRWWGGPQAGQPKLPPAIQSMMSRGMVEVRQERLMYHAFFTEVGLAALRQLAADRRALDPVRYAHIRRELGLSSPTEIALADRANSPGDAGHERLG